MSFIRLAVRTMMAKGPEKIIFVPTNAIKHVSFTPDSCVIIYGDEKVTGITSNDPQYKVLFEYFTKNSVPKAAILPEILPTARMPPTV